METQPDKTPDWSFYHFSKHIGSIPLEEMAPMLRDAGFDGLDLTVRSGGTVEPEQAERLLPVYAEKLGKAGMKIGMLSTGLTHPDDPFADEILRTAASLGITHIKTGYAMYREFGSLRQARTNARAALQALADLLERYNLNAGYHNHSDCFLGASLWDIDYILEGINPQRIGLYFDPAHAVIEGGSCGWKMGLDLMLDRITMLAVKDFRWRPDKSGYAGARLHSVEMCPLESGNVPWDFILAQLQKRSFAGPVSFHGEYQDKNSFALLSDRAVLEQSKRDLAFFRTFLS